MNLIGRVIWDNGNASLKSLTKKAHFVQAHVTFGHWQEIQVKSAVPWEISFKSIKKSHAMHWVSWNKSKSNLLIVHEQAAS